MQAPTGRFLRIYVLLCLSQFVFSRSIPTGLTGVKAAIEGRHFAKRSLISKAPHIHNKRALDIVKDAEELKEAGSVLQPHAALASETDSSLDSASKLNQGNFHLREEMNLRNDNLPSEEVKHSEHHTTSVTPEPASGDDASNDFPAEAQHPESKSDVILEKENKEGTNAEHKSANAENPAPVAAWEEANKGSEAEPHKAESKFEAAQENSNKDEGGSEHPEFGQKVETTASRPLEEASHENAPPLQPSDDEAHVSEVDGERAKSQENKYLGPKNLNTPSAQEDSSASHSTPTDKKQPADENTSKASQTETHEPESKPEVSQEGNSEHQSTGDGHLAHRNEEKSEPVSGDNTSKVSPAEAQHPQEELPVSRSPPNDEKNPADENTSKASQTETHEPESKPEVVPESNYEHQPTSDEHLTERNEEKGDDSNVHQTGVQQPEPHSELPPVNNNKNQGHTEGGIPRIFEPGSPVHEDQNTPLGRHEDASKDNSPELQTGNGDPQEVHKIEVDEAKQKEEEKLKNDDEPLNDQDRLKTHQTVPLVEYPEEDETENFYQTGTHQLGDEQGEITKAEENSEHQPQTNEPRIEIPEEEHYEEGREAAGGLGGSKLEEFLENEPQIVHVQSPVASEGERATFGEQEGSPRSVDRKHEEELEISPKPHGNPAEAQEAHEKNLKGFEKRKGKFTTAIMSNLKKLWYNLRVRWNRFFHKITRTKPGQVPGKFKSLFIFKKVPGSPGEYRDVIFAKELEQGRVKPVAKPEKEIEPKPILSKSEKTENEGEEKVNQKLETPKEESHNKPNEPIVQEPEEENIPSASH